jgi:hypothetical protein
MLVALAFPGVAAALTHRVHGHHELEGWTV